MEDGTVVSLWSGLKKGPPRKLKFPESDIIIHAIEKSLDEDEGIMMKD